jgi:hypothetical protein
MADKTQTYRVKSPMLHDGERYEDGDDVELTAAQAAQALDSRSVAKIERAKAEPAVKVADKK